MFVIEVIVSSGDFPGKVSLRYGSIVKEAYRIMRRNPRITASEAAFIARPYIHPDGSQESEERVVDFALQQSRER